MNFKHLESREKLRGGFYTPIAIAEMLSRWVLDSGAETILEPGCGDGVFFEAMANVMGPSHSPGTITIDGIEIVAAEAAKARKAARKLKQAGAKVRVREGDFFSWIQPLPLTKRWDAVIGNPPYIRYQYFDDEQRQVAEKLFARAGVPFTKRTNAWVPFVIASVMHLAPGGRLAMVLPAELLHILHADGLRQLLEQEMELIELLDVRELAFKDVLQGIVLMRSVKKDGRGFRSLVPRAYSHGAQLSLDNSDEPENGKTAILRIKPLDRVKEFQSIDLENHRNALANGRFSRKWTRGLLDDEELHLLSKIEMQDWNVPFSEIANPDIGIVTGANKYFVVDIETAEAYGLREIASPMLARSQFIDGITYTEADQHKNEEAGKSVLFLEFPDAAKEDLPEGMAEYIALGETQGLHERYKCRIRDPWYRVPYVWASDVSLLKRCHDFPRLVLNESKALSTDTAYRITVSSEYLGREKDLVFSFLNSLTLLCAELEGRHYAGGVLELVPSEIENLLVPLVNTNGSYFEEADQIVRKKGQIDELLDFTDPLILGPGTRANLSFDEIGLLREAKHRLAKRRMRRLL